jgi:hypothetical protein
VPCLPATRRAIAQLPLGLGKPALSNLGRDGHPAQLGLVAGGGAGCCVTAAGLAHEGGAIEVGSSTGTEVVLVVPDGIAKVTVLLPRQRIPGERASKHPASITSLVHDNIAAFDTDRDADAVGTEDMIWYGPAGNVLRLIESNDCLDRVVPARHPSPQTALSERAEKDPSTANSVTVTPARGRPHTTFDVSFRLLLTNATTSSSSPALAGPAATVKSATAREAGLEGDRGTFAANCSANRSRPVTPGKARTSRHGARAVIRSASAPRTTRRRADQPEPTHRSAPPHLSSVTEITPVPSGPR